MLEFKVVGRYFKYPSVSRNVVYLSVDHWNDYSFVTLFTVCIFDGRGKSYKLGNVKIGFCGQTTEIWTYRKIFESSDKKKLITDFSEICSFYRLSDEYFSLGMDTSYYEKLQELRELSYEYCSEFLTGIRDIVYNNNLLKEIQKEEVFIKSFLRTIPLNTIEFQFKRIFEGGVVCTDYDFQFWDDKLSDGECPLCFVVKAGARPSMNIHAIIGRNGVGKTTLLNDMILAATQDLRAKGRFQPVFGSENTSSSYFSNVLSVSFSVFDPFTPPEEQYDPNKGICYSYIGLKKSENLENGVVALKSIEELYDDFVECLTICFSEIRRKERWQDSIKILESDINFANMNLIDSFFIKDIGSDERELESWRSRILNSIKGMSSGHSIVLFTITKLVARLEEKTLVIFDEPECHLHPPLLSALIRSLSFLLSDRNAVAIMATHSPVVLQEIPKSCVWKITRTGSALSFFRPERETFGENVGFLTQDVFGLEVAKSGFSVLLDEISKTASSYEEALGAFDKQIGFEGRTILRSLMYIQGKD